jgi:hypothetical protein
MIERLLAGSMVGGRCEGSCVGDESLRHGKRNAVGALRKSGESKIIREWR